MKSVEMAVVVSEEAEEEKYFAKQKLTIAPHRQRMNALDEQGHDIEFNFKDPPDPLRLVFVCAMWLTGFDAPTVSTLYLDKPMKDHTLMQTIARANRVTSWKIRGVEKKTGELVDYYNVFGNMKKALRDYAQGEEGKENAPVQEKKNLFKLLDEAIAEGTKFAAGLGLDLPALSAKQDVFKTVNAFNAYADKLLEKDARHSAICPARSVSGMKLPEDWWAALAARRLLLLSPFGTAHRRASTALAAKRNEMVCALADHAFIAYMTPGGDIERLSVRLAKWGVPRT